MHCNKITSSTALALFGYDVSKQNKDRLNTVVLLTVDLIT